eukprot:7071550-Prymnesium_polylepis.1
MGCKGGGESGSERRRRGGAAVRVRPTDVADRGAACAAARRAARGNGTRCSAGCSGALCGARIEAHQGKVVDRVVVGDLERDLLVVLEDGLGDDRARASDVPVGQDVAALAVDDKAGRLNCAGGARVEGANAVHLDRDDRGQRARDHPVPMHRVRLDLHRLLLGSCALGARPHRRVQP